MVPFNRPPYIGKEMEYISKAIRAHKICGDGQFTKKCHQLLEQMTGSQKVLLTTSGSHALEMAALLCNLKPGDEVILPSFTFSSTANAFVLAGAKLVFVDIRPDTMNIDETKIEAAITDKTRVIVPVHYAGVACEMDTIMEIARKHNLKVVEDAAQGVMSTYHGKALGTIGDFGCFSFHETKNYSMGEGGALLIRDEENNEAAEILREKGTNRSRFLRGQVDKYTWVGYGSSYLPSDMNAAYLLAQLEEAEKINNARLASWHQYQEGLAPLEQEGKLEIANIPEGCSHNAHMFWIKLRDLEERTAMIAYLKEHRYGRATFLPLTSVKKRDNYLKEHGIYSMFHYVPLHSAEAGQKFGRFAGEDVYTTKESNRLTRLPMYYGLEEKDIKTVCNCVKKFYER